jgi:hypothetical protein
MVGVDVGIEDVNELEPEVCEQLRVRLDLAQDRIDERSLARLRAADEIRVGARDRFLVTCLAKCTSGASLSKRSVRPTGTSRVRRRSSA